MRVGHHPSHDIATATAMHFLPSEFSHATQRAGLKTCDVLKQVALWQALFPLPKVPILL
jgi:hypothetical protein